MDAKKLHEVSGKVLDAKSKVEMYQYIVDRVKEGGKLSGKLEYELDKNRRSARFEWLGTEDILPLIEKRLKEAQEDLAGFENDFKNYTK